MLAMLGNYHHYLIQVVFTALKAETPFLKHRVPRPPLVGINNLHISPRMTLVQILYTSDVIHYLSFHVCFISFKVLKIHWCYSMSSPTFALSTLSRKCFQFFSLRICSLYIPWILKRHFVHVYKMLYHVVSISCLPQSLPQSCFHANVST